jgi:hypothetical protein
MRVYISCRRNAKYVTASRLHDQLATAFGDEDVFLCDGAVSADEPLTKASAQAITEADIMLVLVDADFAQAFNEPPTAEAQALTLELQLGLQLDKSLLLVMLDDAQLPSPENLPTALRNLSSGEMFNLQEASFTQHAQALIAYIRKASALKTQRRGKRWRVSPEFIFTSLFALFGLLIAVPSFFSDLQDLRPEPTPSSTRTLRPSETPIPSDTPTATPTPTITPTPMPDIAAVVRAESRVCPPILREPQALEVVASDAGLQIWGYSTLDNSLFVAEPACTGGERVTLPAELGTVEPSALYYDGTWLWLGDKADGRVIALDPTTRETLLILDLPGANATPNAITSSDGVLWVGLRNQRRIVSFRYDVNSVTSDTYCGSIFVSGDVKGLAIEGQTRLWVAHGRGEGGVLQGVDLLTCSLTGLGSGLGAEVFDLAYADETVWLIAGRELVQVDTRNSRIEHTGVTGVDSLLLTANAIWLTNTQRQVLMRYSLLTSSIDLRFNQVDTQTALAQNGVQIWAAQADGSLARYLVPDIIHAGVVDIVWRNDTLWFVDWDRNLCHHRATVLTCRPLVGLGAEPTRLALASDPDRLWLGTDDGWLWRINTQTAEAEQFTRLPAAASTLAEETNERLWAAGDGYALVVPLDAPDDVRSVVNFALGVPQFITFDGSRIWFAETSRYYPVVYDASLGTAQVEGAAFSLNGAPLAAFEVDRTGVYMVRNGELEHRNRLTGAIIKRTGVGNRVTGFTLATRGQAWLADERGGFIYTTP